MSSDKSRFDGLFSVARAKADPQTSANDSEASKRLDVQTSKSSNPEYQRTTLYIPKSLHKRFKAAAVTEDKDMSDIMTELIRAWIESRDT